MAFKITTSIDGIDRELANPHPSVKPLRELEYFVNSVIPKGVDPSKKGAHKYRQAPPTYFLGYFWRPATMYDALKRKGRQEATVQATLEKYLASVRRITGLTWGDGIQKEIIDGEEWWLFYAVQSSRKEDIQAIAMDQEARKGLRRAMGAAEDPLLISYHHPRVRSTCESLRSCTDLFSTALYLLNRIHLYTYSCYGRHHARHAGRKLFVACTIYIPSH